MGDFCQQKLCHMELKQTAQDEGSLGTFYFTYKKNEYNREDTLEAIRSVILTTG